MRNCPDRPLEPSMWPRWHELLEDRGGCCAHRFDITDPLCKVCSGKDKECDRYERE